MANDLTGEFDVVAEVSVPAVNRILAAMHRAERFLHSIAIRVDDTPPRRPRDDKFSIVASVDTSGDPIVDHTRIGTPIPASGQLYATDPIFRLLDPVVNPGLTGATVGSIVPSNLKGRAQLQLSPPTVDVTDASGSNMTVGMDVMARYFPDPNTSPLREFVRGRLQITARVSQVASQTANVIDVDLKAADVKINFSPVPSTPLSDADLAGINQLIRNALKTSFLPSSNPLPPNIHYLKFKTLLGTPNAIAALVNMGDVSGNPASMTNIFLGSEDDFAFAASRDFILAAFNPVIDNLLRQPVEPFQVHVRFLGNATYTISLSSATFDLQAGKIVLTIQGHAHTPAWWAPDFDFTAKLDFSLRANGATADLVVGDVSLDTSSWIVNQFKGRALDGIRKARDAALAQQDADGLDAFGKVNRLLSADRNLGEVLSSLLKSPDQSTTQPQLDLKPDLAYTAVEIQPSGIVLHGSLAVPDWPPPHVEFEQIPGTTGPHHGPIHTGPDYSALKSWIPGGTIQQYEWSYQGQAQPFRIEKDKFVLLHPDLVGELGGPALARTVPGLTSLCLTVQGVRLSASGPVAEETVRATACEYRSWPILNGLSVAALKGDVPLVTLTQPGPGGLVRVVGHASAPQDSTGSDPPNLLLHFANEQTVDHLDLLTQALRESGREDAATAIVAVVPTHQLTKARHTEGVIYSDEQGGAWERVFGLKPARPPHTLVIGPKNDILWQDEGAFDSATLAGALRKVLVKAGPIRPSTLRLSLRFDRLAPNFLFEPDPGREQTLRKLKGYRVELVFCRRRLKPSIETARDRLERARKAGAQAPVVIAIADREAPESAKEIAAEIGPSAIVVPDPQRDIALAYDVTIWPTRVLIDALGLVREIRYGRFTEEHSAYPARERGAAVR